MTTTDGCHDASPYAGATVAVGTRHGKESAFAPALGRWVGVTVRATSALDTDALGTFTGDVPRAVSPMDAAAAKAAGAADELGTPFGIATEASYATSLGGFGPVVHEELAVFLDLERGIRVPHGLRAYARVAVPRDVQDECAARAYLEGIGFPDQAVVVRFADQLVKGVQDEDLVLGFLRQGAVRLEPDLRAHMNPQRRRILRRLAWGLAARLRTPCPECAAPGFGPVDVIRGVPCGVCGTPTSRVRADVDGCATCPARRERPRPVAVADPATCDVCNP
ncbi:MAG: hypothetical protein BGO45_13020 [Microbacterium sp. 71-36]|uniref:DUF6671 family protein n=1 Tax=unclassified Microbacterium TaxID=2609290 RepID=UPI00086A1B0D|nr:MULTISPECIES: DUF6671 family protein [unclassified Microbacterium]MBN9211814.1 hypothetical protein [Microbacterium sp.]ODT37671.1 MAG: hypothetical protein ABS60_12480 [Microbacterium sp. SCN 71-17]OJV77663.1 MAG: hypothetical protein BGO45_13020 [Microbacterium sp. 71-36]